MKQINEKCKIKLFNFNKQISVANRKKLYANLCIYQYMRKCEMKKMQMQNITYTALKKEV